MMNSQGKLHLLTAKFTQLVVLPPTQMQDRQLLALTEHGQVWNYNETTDEWHLLNSERVLPK